jgi:integrase/recombinase XerD
MDQLFAQFLKERIYLRNVTPKTAVWYEQAWKTFKASQKGADDVTVTKATLQAFVIHMRERGLKPVTCNTWIKAMNAICGWLHDEGHTPTRLELQTLKTEKRVLVTLSETHIRQLLTAKPRTFNQWRVFALTCLLLDTGMRIDEALGLNVTDVDLDNLLLRVFGKGRKERIIPFSFELRKTLYRFLKVREQHALTPPLLFAARSGAKWHQRNALRAYYLLLKRLSIPKSGFHRIRHTFATQYLKAGGDVVRLSKVLGHSQVTTTMRYEHLLTEDLQAPHQRLSLLNRLR